MVSFSLLSPSLLEKVSVVDLPPDDEAVFKTPWPDSIKAEKYFSGMNASWSAAHTIPVAIACDSHSRRVPLPFAGEFDCGKNSTVPFQPFIAQMDISIVPNCGFWNETSQKWSTNGCRVVNVASEGITCACNHLTTMATLLQRFRSRFKRIVTTCFTDTCSFRHIQFTIFPMLVCTYILIGSGLFFAHRKDNRDVLSELQAQKSQKSPDVQDRPRPLHLLGPAKIYTHDIEQRGNKGLIESKLEPSATLATFRDALVAITRRHSWAGLFTLFDHEHTRTRRVMTQSISVFANFSVSCTLFQSTFLPTQTETNLPPTLLVAGFTASTVFVLRKGVEKMFGKCPSLYYNAFYIKRMRSISARQDLGLTIKATDSFPDLFRTSGLCLCKMCSLPFESVCEFHRHIVNVHLSGASSTRVSVMDVAEIVHSTHIFLRTVLTDKKLRTAHEPYLLLYFLKTLSEESGLSIKTCAMKTKVEPLNHHSGWRQKSTSEANIFREGPKWIKERLCASMSPFDRFLFNRYGAEKKPKKLFSSFVTYLVLVFCLLFIAASTAYTLMFALHAKQTEIHLEWIQATLLGLVLSIMVNEPIFILCRVMAFNVLTKRLTSKTILLEGSLAAFVDAFTRSWVSGERRPSHYVRDGCAKSLILEKSNDAEIASYPWANGVAVRVSNSNLSLPFAKARGLRSTIWSEAPVARATRVHEDEDNVCAVWAKSRSFVGNVWEDSD